MSIISCISYLNIVIAIIVFWQWQKQLFDLSNPEICQKALVWWGGKLLLIVIYAFVCLTFLAGNIDSYAQTKHDIIDLVFSAIGTCFVLIVSVFKFFPLQILIGRTILFLGLMLILILLNYFESPQLFWLVSIGFLIGILLATVTEVLISIHQIANPEYWEKIRFKKEVTKKSDRIDKGALRQAVGFNKLELVIETFLKTLPSHDPVYREVLNHQRRIHELSEQLRKGLLNLSDYNFERNKISHALLELIESY